MKTLADRIKDYNIHFDRQSAGRYLRGAALSLALVLSSPHILASSSLNRESVTEYKTPPTPDTTEVSRKTYSGRKNDVFSLMDVVDDNLKADIVNKFKEIDPYDFRRISQRVNRFEPIIKFSSDVYDTDVNLVTAVIHQESNGNPRAISPKGALGLMQLMPDTVEEIAKKYSRRNKRIHRMGEVMAPAKNIDYGTSYLRGLIEMYNGNVILGLAAYNTGPGRVNEILRRRNMKPEDADWKRIKYALGEETREHIPGVFSKVLKMREVYVLEKIKALENLNRVLNDYRNI